MKWKKILKIANSAYPDYDLNEHLNPHRPLSVLEDPTGSALVSLLREASSSGGDPGYSGDVELQNVILMLDEEISTLMDVRYAFLQERERKAEKIREQTKREQERRSPLVGGGDHNTSNTQEYHPR